MDINQLLDGQPITLEQILVAREERVSIQRRLLYGFKLPVICFTLNIAGPVKLFDLALKAFDRGKELINKKLEQSGHNLASCEEKVTNTGCEAFFVVEGDAHSVKKVMVDIEDGEAIGRLFDMDVIKPDGEKLSREDIGLPPRRCLLCNNPAVLCARSRNHSLELIQRETVRMLKNYFDHEYAERIASLAQRSILYEVCVTPKPGLVDRHHSGAHKDMDIYTFMSSASVLYPYFYRFVLHGLSAGGKSPKELFRSARYLGIEAEEAMLKSTHGVNTHKGIIFSIGIICIALGYLHGKALPETLESLQLLCREMVCSDMENDFKKIPEKTTKTNGERLYALYGLTGIRGEAASGFSSVIRYGLPTFQALMAQGCSLNDTGALTLLHLIAHVEDTNIIARSNPEVLRLVQQEIGLLIESLLPGSGDQFDREIFDKSINSHDVIDRIKKLDDLFMHHNISPGGCADLLAVTFMLYFLSLTE